MDEMAMFGLCAPHRGHLRYDISVPDVLLLTGLTLLASLSPLLTFASLWQIKEWRVDRLREHLRAEGLLRQLFGVGRPLRPGSVPLPSCDRTRSQVGVHPGARRRCSVHARPQLTRESRFRLVDE